MCSMLFFITLRRFSRKVRHVGNHECQSSADSAFLHLSHQGQELL